MQNTIGTKMITEIKGMRFMIPSYQRGYRWTRQEVRDLLSDLMEFRPRDDKQKYCLQPIVVKEMPNGQWEVIDGQQRLTTILIFMRIAEEILPTVKMPYQLEYETREGSDSFLQCLSDKSAEVKEDNIDYYYIFNAWKSMKEWFNEQPDYLVAVQEMYVKMMKNAMIIWYEIKDGSDPVDIFTRINMGKIPLTNAELIKALFLKQDNFILTDMPPRQTHEIYKRQLEISADWDRIEQSLREDAFWMFLMNRDRHYDPRIDYIFELLAKEKNDSLDSKISDTSNMYFSFLVFDQLFKETATKDKSLERLLDDIWEEVGRYHNVFREWFQDAELYHRIGYLVASGEKTADKIKQETAGKKKSEISTYLIEKITSSLKNVKDLGDLTYDENKDTVRRVLLLFNVETIVRSKSSVRFPFDMYKKQQWDIEHIHAINTKPPDTPKGRKELLEERKQWLQEIDPEAVKNIDEFLQQGGAEDEFEFKNFLDTIHSKYGENEIDDISNLALLDAETNRSYKNAYFPVKRKTIIERDKGAVFVPVCTKNVFLKLYSSSPVDMSYWSAVDRSHYVNEMQRTLAKFIQGGGENHE